MLSPELPLAYLGWRSKLGEEATVFFDGRDFALAPLDRLSDPIRIDGKSAPWIEQARLYVESIQQATGGSSSVDGDENEVQFSRIARFLTIGDENEDLLCVDPEDGYSVWIFMPGEGGIVDRLHESLEAWIDEVEPAE